MAMQQSLIGTSAVTRELLAHLERVAPTDAPVLVRGPTGVGKELVAREIHRLSGRDPKGDFVAVNCSAIPNELLESEIFGHEKGAFSGAVSSYQGRMRLADGGSLLLDEIGDMPPDLQVKLLRFVQERTIERIGGRKPIAVDTRIVCATHQDLEAMIGEGTFREDLFYRLNVVEVHLPALRDRLSDMPLLVNHLIHQAAHNPGVTSASEDVMQLFSSYRWPGNIRELENRIKKAVVFSDNGVISPEHLDLGSEKVSGMLSLSEAREAWQRDYINAALAMYDGNRTQTARVLDVDPRTIFRHLERERGES